MYFGVGLDADAVKFFRFVAFLMMLVICGQSFGLFIGSSFKRMEIASAITPVCMMPILLFGGFFSNLGTVGQWLGWLQYLSPIRYTNELLIRNEFEGVDLSPTENPIDSLDLNIGMTLCAILLLVIGFVLRILSVILLKLLEDRVE